MLCVRICTCIREKRVWEYLYMTICIVCAPMFVLYVYVILLCVSVSVCLCVNSSNEATVNSFYGSVNNDIHSAARCKTQLTHAHKPVTLDSTQKSLGKWSLKSRSVISKIWESDNNVTRARLRSLGYAQWSFANHKYPLSTQGGPYFINYNWQTDILFLSPFHFFLQTLLFLVSFFLSSSSFRCLFRDHATRERNNSFAHLKSGLLSYHVDPLPTCLLFSAIFVHIFCLIYLFFFFFYIIIPFLTSSWVFLPLLLFSFSTFFSHFRLF